jgi:ribosomal protein L15
MVEAKGGKLNIIASEKTFVKINFDKIKKWFPTKNVITPEDLKKIGVLKDSYKIELTRGGAPKRPYEVHVHKANRSAREKLERFGGKVVIIEG